MMMCGAKCPPVHPSLRTCVRPCLHLSVRLCVHRFVHASVDAGVYLLVSLCVSLFVSRYLFLCLTLPVCVSDDKPEPPRHSALTALRRPGSTNDPTRMATIQETDRNTRCPRTQAQPTQQQIGNLWYSAIYNVLTEVQFVCISIRLCRLSYCYRDTAGYALRGPMLVCISFAFKSA